MLVQEGEGWRLVVDPARHAFPVLIGGSHWAAELAPEEAGALRSGIGRLLDQHRALVDALLEEEAITLEFETALEPDGGLWLELEGSRRDFALRFVLQPPPGRRALEGAWPVGASAAFAAAITQAEGIVGRGGHAP
ncbi:DUF1818 family protein [Cyanobium sp. FGCU-52]|nr:DUF1818 family protein [Cyanobium sp. FGCU52]